MSTIYSALFLDFDNVWHELDRYDPVLAARFANKPLMWLNALQEELAIGSGAAHDRRIVSRRCYASPHLIQPYRRNFTQTGFEVVDCPPLTTHHKNSADIYIVMDVIDYLGRYPHLGEYIILSGDADFVPVLNRLRKELKRSVIFASYNTTAAYRNCSDQRIEAEFFEHCLAPEASAPRALGTGQEPDEPVSAEPLQPQLAERLRRCIRQAAERRAGRLPFATAAHALLNGMRDELGGSWAGRRTFTALLADLDLGDLTVDWGGQMIELADFVLELPDWDAEDRERLVDFVSDVAGAASKHIPLLRPSDYSMIFEALSDHYRHEEPGTFTEAVKAVAESCRARGGSVTDPELRFIATGISMQGYRFVEGADATHLASLWRVQVFELCGQPEWLRESEDAALLAAWIHAPGESEEEAKDDFLSRTAAPPAPEAVPG